MGWIQEFREFAMKGNVVDLALGVVIGGAFGKIVSSLVSDVMMPPIGMLTGGVNFTSLKFVLQNPMTMLGSQAAEQVTINYGHFIQTLVDFLIVAFALFMVVKAMNRLRRNAPPAPAEPPAQEKLLTEIRDLLKAQA